MQIKIERLKIKDFKGIKNLELDMNAKDVNIFAENAKGKTSIYDAFLWVLFDKDSKDRSKFSINPVDENNEIIKGLEPTVEVELIIFRDEGGFYKVKLLKSYREVYKTKRGTSEKVFEGYTNYYEVDDVPCGTQKEYLEKVSFIGDPDKFKLLTSPIYFNEQLHWKERRKILTDMCDMKSGYETVLAKEEYAEIRDELERKKPEDVKKMYASQKKKIKAEIDVIPARKEENEKIIEDCDLSKIKEAKAEHKKLEKKEKELKEKVDQLKSGDTSGLKKELRELDGELAKIEKDFDKKHGASLKAYKDKDSKLYIEQVNAKQSYTLVSNQLPEKKRKISELKQKLETLRGQFKEISDRTFEFKQTDTCPTCKQKLPADKLKATKDEAFKMFTEQKKKELEQNNQTGIALSETLKEVETEVKDLEIREANLLKQKEAAEKAYAEHQKLELDDSLHLEKEKATAEVRKLISLKEEEIKKAESEGEAAAKIAKNKLNDIRQEMHDLEYEISKENNIKKAKERIQEISKEHTKLSSEYEEVERLLSLTESFIVDVVKANEETVNSMFERVNFKMFEIQLNGGIKETCEVLYEGRPYSTLSTAEGINAGLDVIKTLSNQTDFSAPIFIDNAESICELFVVNAQIIRLVVSEAHKNLTMEVNNG